MIKFQKQAVMRKVVYSLIPVMLLSVFFYGWSVSLIYLFSVISAVLAEWLLVRKQGGKVTDAVFVTAIIYACTLPPGLPIYMVVLGSVFGVVFAKMAFGGFGMNVFNPAMVGRAFVYIAFPTYMTNQWFPTANFTQFPAGLIRWKFYDAETFATPMIAVRSGFEQIPGMLKLFLGNINGTMLHESDQILCGGGCIGEASALLILLCGGYLLIKKIANLKVVLTFFISYVVIQTIFYYLFPDQSIHPLYGLLSGGIVFGGFYMITDPISMAKTNQGKYIYGFSVAFFTVLIRGFSLFAEGFMFALLLGNMFNPIIDYSFNQLKKRKTK